MNATDYYIEDCGGHSLLNRENEICLLKQAKNGDKQALDILARKNQRLVMKIARRYEARAGDQDILDLIQWGNMGMLEAIRRFDVNRNFRFSTYAVYWIEAYIRRYSQARGNCISISYMQGENKNKVSRARNDLFERLQREPNIQEISEYSHLPSEIVTETIKLIENKVVSLNHIKNARDQSCVEVLGNIPADEILSDATSETPEDLGSELVETHLVRKQISHLPQREQFILCHIYGVNGSQVMTFDEIGQQLGISRTRVGQIRDKAVKKLGEILNSANV